MLFLYHAPISTCSQKVRLVLAEKGLEWDGMAINFGKGEHLTTEFCHKYTLETFANLAATTGLAVSRVWMDPEKKFSVQLLEPRSLQ